MLQALGITTKHAPHARRLLSRAGERIAAVDRSFVGFELHRPPRRGGTWASSRGAGYRSPSCSAVLPY